MMFLLLRVDDVGWLPVDKTTDRGLVYFRRWREAFGIAGYPVVYGVIPALMDAQDSLDLQGLLRGREQLAVHGYDHSANAQVTREQMAWGHGSLGKPRSYIPPFNEYTTSTLSDWSQHGPYFFGGFRGAHHNLGNLPIEFHLRERLIHLPACQRLYGRVGELLDRLHEFADYQCPIVVTLHATWDHARMDLLSPLLRELEPHLRSVDDVPAWLDRSAFELKQLSAAHFIPQNWMAERIEPFGTLLDFGSKETKWPAKMALRGSVVTAVDQYDRFEADQQAICASLDARVRVLNHLRLPEHDRFQTITSIWAIQHNEPERQAVIVADLAARLKRGGELLICSSFTPGAMFYQENRADPQWVLGPVELNRLVIQASGCALIELTHFHYEFNSVEGYCCQPERANAVLLRLRKS